MNKDKIKAENIKILEKYSLAFEIKKHKVYAQFDNFVLFGDIYDKSFGHNISEYFEDEYKILNLNLNSKAVLDLGSNIGEFAIKCVLNGANVICFEPNRKVYKLLQKNIKQNNFKHQITTYNKGAWTSRTYKLIFYKKHGTGAASILRTNLSIKSKLLTRRLALFKLINLNRFLQNNVKFYLLKIDIEGAEHLLISKLTKLDKTHLPDRIVLEYHGGIKDLISNFEKIGYRTKSIPKNETTGLIFANRIDKEII